MAYQTISPSFSSSNKAALVFLLFMLLLLLCRYYCCCYVVVVVVVVLYSARLFHRFLSHTFFLCFAPIVSRPRARWLTEDGNKDFLLLATMKLLVDTVLCDFFLFSFLCSITTIYVKYGRSFVSKGSRRWRLASVFADRPLRIDYTLQRREAACCHSKFTLVRSTLKRYVISVYV